PGYPEVLQRIRCMNIVGQVAAHAGLPECRIGLTHQPDGLPVYVLLCPELFERSGSPYVDGAGAEWEDNAVRFATFAHAAAGIGVPPAHLADMECHGRLSVLGAGIVNATRINTVSVS